MVANCFACREAHRVAGRRCDPRRPVEIPLATEGLLEDTDGLLRQWPLGAVSLLRLPSADVRYSDDVIAFKGRSSTLEVLHTPGHTAGSACFMLVDSGVVVDGPVGVGGGLGGSVASAAVSGGGNSPNVLFTGDTLFIGSCGKWFDNEGLAQLTLSLERLSTLPPSTIVFPG